MCLPRFVANGCEPHNTHKETHTKTQTFLVVVMVVAAPAVVVVVVAAAAAVVVVVVAVEL